MTVDRIDDDLGPVRRCRVCCEWWPLDLEFFRTHSKGSLRRTCRACMRDQMNSRPIPLRSVTRGPELDIEARKARERARKAALRRDPVLGDKMRARQREAWHRHYDKNHTAILERRRQEYAAQLDRPLREGIGRPRIAA